MSNIDRQRIAAVRAMETLGYTFTGIKWRTPEAAEWSAPEAAPTTLLAAATLMVTAMAFALVLTTPEPGILGAMEGWLLK